jgi:hypothetical protein
MIGGSEWRVVAQRRPLDAFAEPMIPIRLAPAPDRPLRVIAFGAHVLQGQAAEVGALC